MAMPQPNLLENPIKLSKLRNHNYNYNIPQKRNSRLSFWAFVFSICMYISIFYMFNLSPYTLINTTNFWFFISNTLILIITIDFNFGSNFSYSSSIDQEYYMKICQEKSTITSTPSFNYSSYTIKKKEIIIPHEEEHIKDVILIENNKQRDEDKEQIINITDSKKEKKGEVKFYRINSELKAMMPVDKNEKKLKRIQRSKSERYNDLQVNGDEEINDEFLDMSVEELNKRVEEFIQRFNTQIRLQRKLQ